MTDQELDMMKFLKMNIHLQQKEINWLKKKTSELETSNAGLLAALDDLIDECWQAEDCGLIDWKVMGKAREEAHKARGLQQ